MRISMFHKGVGFSIGLKTFVKVLAALFPVLLAAYFWVYPSHAASLFDDDFEGDFIGEWTDWDDMNCDRGVVISTDYAHSGAFSLSADRSGAAPACTDQIRSITGHYDADTVQISWWMLATETNITTSSLIFYGDDATGAGVGGVNMVAEDFRLSGGTVILDNTVADNTWYRIDWRYDTSTDCQTAKINSGAWATPECGMDTGEYISRVRYKAAGSVSTITYIDQLLLTTSSGAGAGVLPPEFDAFFADPSLSIADIIADYPSHDDVYGACDFWTDGFDCLWTWIEYAVVPVQNELGGLLQEPLETMITRWPWAYVSVPFREIQEGLTSGDCPFEESLLGGTFMGSALPEVDLCVWADDIGFDELMDDHPWSEGMIISSIYLMLGVTLFKIGQTFLMGE